ncbi:putative xyloglucan endotransglucosylase/hydrolase protein 1 [Iris pallida]|uniref:Xyloglucan endotransglucosylase/hydrolase n=1 Tax=Iris pallida TaxID=29817 RepID=A0AAX6IAY2_IRIPA|nr:putative xyloglucan endotransglucosylase/hydrolase protein 1 [Iris pallida]KAJ6850399.1 putative xyloglucan endotransglucosylase/hydrolase protein 1 [Iris pallida]
MASFLIFGLLFSIVHEFGSVVASEVLHDQTGFDQNYVITWGQDHVKNNGRGEVQLFMDKSSGCGFGSRQSYSSGLFRLSIKTPSKNSAGVVTAFYLSSNTSNHDELDFEFLGNREGKPITLQTNVFANGHGNREERINLHWFDPSDGFHDYKVLWNPYHTVFFIDDIPIRIFKNLTSKAVEYPSQPMRILVSLWNGEDWATDGGRTKIDWSNAPFVAQFQGFDVDGCASDGSGGGHSCSSSSSGSWWNDGKYKALTPEQESAYRKIRQYMTYDYCSDKGRFPKLPPECPQ